MKPLCFCELSDLTGSADFLTRIRRDLHRQPELSFHETATAAMVADRLTEWGYIFGAVFSTYIIFALMFVSSVVLSGGDIRESTIKGLAAAYGNIGYMGPGLALLAFGEEAAVPVALIFCFENIMHFAVAPMMMALAGGEVLALGLPDDVIGSPEVKRVYLGS